MKQNLRVNKTNFHMKSFAPGLALKQRRKATQKSRIVLMVLWTTGFRTYVCMTLVASLFARFCPDFCSMWSKLCSANLVHCQTSRPKFKREVCSCAGSLASICCFSRTFSNQVCFILWWLLLSYYFSFIPSHPFLFPTPFCCFPFCFLSFPSISIL